MKEGRLRISKVEKPTAWWRYSSHRSHFLGNAHCLRSSSQSSVVETPNAKRITSGAVEWYHPYHTDGEENAREIAPSITSVLFELERSAVIVSEENHWEKGWDQTISSRQDPVCHFGGRRECVSQMFGTNCGGNFNMGCRCSGSTSVWRFF